VDIDRADYLKRDTHQTGVAYGRYDLDWLISTLTLGEEEVGSEKRWVLGFDSNKAVRVIEQFLIARQALYETVYHHKTVRCAEGMVAMFLRRVKKAVQDGVKFETSGFVEPMRKMIAGEVVPIRELLTLDDFSLFVLIENVSQSHLKDHVLVDLAKRITARDLFKWVPIDSRKISEFIEKAGSREKLYDAIRTLYPSDPEYYIIEDTAKFTMMEKGERDKVYLVDEDGFSFPAHDHESLRSYRYVEGYVKRIFTAEDALEKVTALINDEV
jgi:HD superfamily phosphohydrolase